MSLNQSCTLRRLSGCHTVNIQGADSEVCSISSPTYSHSAIIIGARAYWGLRLTSSGSSSFSERAVELSGFGAPIDIYLGIYIDVRQRKK